MYLENSEESISPMLTFVTESELNHKNLGFGYNLKENPLHTFFETLTINEFGSCRGLLGYKQGLVGSGKKKSQLPFHVVKEQNEIYT